MRSFLAARTAVAAMAMAALTVAAASSSPSSQFLFLNNPRGLSGAGGGNNRARMRNASKSNFTCPNKTMDCCLTTNTVLGTAKACHDYLLGLACCVVSGSGSILGMIYMKEGAAAVDRTPVEKRLKCPGMKKGLWLGVFPMNWQWWWGLVLLGLLPLPFDGAALSFSPQSLIYPIGTATTVIVGQVVAPRLFFKTEKLTRLEWFGTFLIVVGAAVASAFGAHENKSYTVVMILVSGGKDEGLVFRVPFTHTHTYTHAPPGHMLRATLSPTNSTSCCPTLWRGDDWPRGAPTASYD